jgi:uncharacterized NAD(P)/FAD-binding protein YdhS
VKTIAIIGGGFSGTLTAVNLARFAEVPLRVVIINRGFPLGRGVAYSTARGEHLLNVAARNMSALPDQPNHLLDWLRTRNEFADVPEATLRETFIPRRVYGDYLRALYQTYAKPIDPKGGAQIESIDDEAIDVVDDGNRATVLLASGASVEADKVLLATGNQPPVELPTSLADRPFRHPAYCETPWVNLASRMPSHHDTAILLGTGLTTIDAVLTLEELGWRGAIIAVSRNGLLPLSHFKGIEYPDFPPEDIATKPLADVVALVEEHCGRLRAMGANPAIVVDKLRPHTQRLWQNLSLDEKREFCSRYASRWNVTRHRIAPQIHQTVTNAQERGQLQVVKGRITNLEAAGDRVRVTLTEADGSSRALEGSLVVNCTGPLASFRASPLPLFQNLIARGLVRPDAPDMGIDVAADFAVFDRDGNRSPILFAMGPLAKGTLWETTAVPELRGQAFRVAQTLLDECSAGERRPELWLAEEAVIEYVI